MSNVVSGPFLTCPSAAQAAHANGAAPALLPQPPPPVGSRSQAVPGHLIRAQELQLSERSVVLFVQEEVEGKAG